MCAESVVTKAYLDKDVLTEEHKEPEVNPITLDELWYNWYEDRQINPHLEEDPW